jgi:hypothetical protein
MNEEQEGFSPITIMAIMGIIGVIGYILFAVGMGA